VDHIPEAVNHIPEEAVAVDHTPENLAAALHIPEGRGAGPGRASRACPSAPPRFPP
jgi:hypothetical protein